MAPFHVTGSANSANRHQANEGYHGDATAWRNDDNHRLTNYQRPMKWRHGVHCYGRRRHKPTSGVSPSCCLIYIPPCCHLSPVNDARWSSLGYGVCLRWESLQHKMKPQTLAGSGHSVLARNAVLYRVRTQPIPAVVYLYIDQEHWPSRIVPHNNTSIF